MPDGAGGESDLHLQQHRRTLLGFYLTFTGSYQVLTPVLLMTYLLLWVAPMLPLVWTVDNI